MRGEGVSKANGKTGRLVGRAFEGKGKAVSAQNLLHQRQAEAAPVFLGAKKRREQALGYFWTDPRARILDHGKRPVLELA